MSELPKTPLLDTVDTTIRWDTCEQQVQDIAPGGIPPGAIFLSCSLVAAARRNRDKPALEFPRDMTGDDLLRERVGRKPGDGLGINAEKAAVAGFADERADLNRPHARRIPART